MKRTTYIMAGMLLAGLVVIAGFLFYMAAHRTNIINNSLNITGVAKTVQLPPCKTVQVLVKQDKQEDDIWLTATEGGLVVQPTDSLIANLTYADGLDSYMSMQSNGDTLNIVLDFSTDKLEESFRKRSWLSIKTGLIRLNIPSTVENITVGMNGLTTSFEKFNRDSLSFDVHSTAIVADCRFTSLSAHAGDLQLKSGEIENLYMNLDHIRDWKTDVDNCHIGTEHLSGSGQHNNQLQKGEARQVLWTPLTEKASLKLTLNQAAKVEVGN